MAYPLAEAARNGARWERPTGEWHLWRIGEPDAPVATIRTRLLPPLEGYEARGMLGDTGWQALSRWSTRTQTVTFTLRRPEALTFTYERLLRNSPVPLDTSYGVSYQLSVSLFKGDVSVSTSDGSLLVKHSLSPGRRRLSLGIRTTVTDAALSEPHLDCLLLASLFMRLTSSSGGAV